MKKRETVVRGLKEAARAEQRALGEGVTRG